MVGLKVVNGVDGCFLKGICRNELHAAVGRNSNNHMYPLAWVVVNVKNKKTWKWVLDLLMEDIGGGNGSGLTLISDGHVVSLLLHILSLFCYVLFLHTLKQLIMIRVCWKLSRTRCLQLSINYVLGMSMLT